MPRYIDAEKIVFFASSPWKAIATKSSVDNIPTADVEEVRHGEWIGSIDFPIMQAMIRCSLCNEPSITMSKFCPNCGAKMDLEVKQ